MALASGRRQEGDIGFLITKTEGALVERCRRARRDDRLAVLEGLHALKHALRFDAAIEGVFSPDPDKLAKLARQLAPDVVDKIDNLVERVSSDAFQDLAPHAPKTAVLTLAHRPETSPDQALSPKRQAPVILLEDPAHFGNIGATIRVAAASGAAAVVTTGLHDPWDPAALRGSAGLHFAQPVLRLSALPMVDRPLLAIDPEGDVLDPSTLPADAILAFGSERHGLSEALLDRADRRLTIPMEPHVSSLNLATAVAVTLYAWRLNKQRSSGKTNHPGF